MARLFYHVMQDNLGNLLFDVSGTMRLAGTGTLATIYGDPGLSVILGNPMTNHPSFGSFKCFLAPGSYDFYMAKSGYTFETLTGVQGLGTMSGQDGGAVAITGGSVNNVAINTNQFVQLSGTPLALSIPNRSGDSQIGLFSDFAATPGSGRAFINHGGTAHSYLGGGLQVTGKMALGNTLALNPSAHLKIDFNRGSEQAIEIRPADSDTVGGGSPILFVNTGLTPVGSIQTNATTTTFNTTSDARLKHAVHDLTGELALIQALRPVRFVWNADGEPGVGFLASEVAQHVAGVITGDADAVDEQGGIVPQMIDYSKLVPYLVGAIKTLQARIAVLEDAAGV